MKYDLAVDVSCSQSMTSSLIVGFSGAQFRIGSRGKWDRLFNISIPRPSETNKYKTLPLFLHDMGMRTHQILPQLILSPEEKEEGKMKVRGLIGINQAPVIGIFIGGRKSKGKKWPAENFLKLITALRAQKINIVVFFGPDEKNRWDFLSNPWVKTFPLSLSPL